MAAAGIPRDSSDTDHPHMDMDEVLEEDNSICLVTLGDGEHGYWVIH